MRRLYDKIMRGDMRMYAQDFDTPKDANMFTRLAKKVAPNSRIHVRRGNHVVIKTNFSADAWAMTFNIVLTTYMKMDEEAPDYVWGLASQCVKYARKHKSWWPMQGERRVECKEILSLIGSQAN